jgi:FAD/FMN-containing dehydrogenase
MNKKELMSYETDASMIQGKAEKVIFPKSSEEIKSIIRISNQDIVPRGAGTSLVGGAVPNNSIIIDMSKMNKVLNFDKSKGIVEVEAGITIKELNDKLNAVGLEFPIQPSNNGVSTIGGMIATNACDNRTMKYGRMRDWVDKIEFVNGKSEILELGKADLSDACGMEGTTGIITKAKLKIAPLLKRTISTFQSDNLDDALSIARRLKTEEDVLMIELFPKQLSLLLGFPEKYNLIVEFSSERGKIKDKEYEEIISYKEKVFYVLASEGYYINEDLKLFFDKYKEFFLFLEQNKIPYYGHLGSGIIDIYLKQGEEEKRKMITELIQKMRAKPGKNGIGILKKNLFDSVEKKVFERIKERHDPSNKLNRGKLADYAPMAKRVINKEEKIEAEERIEPIKQDTVLNKQVIPNKVEIKKEVNEPHRAEISYEERLKAYKETFESELSADKMKTVEQMAMKIPKDIMVKQTKTKEDEQKIKNIMTNNAQKPVENTYNKVNSLIKESEVAQSKGKLTKEEQEAINKVMKGGFGFKI